MRFRAWVGSIVGVVSMVAVAQAACYKLYNFTCCRGVLTLAAPNLTRTCPPNSTACPDIITSVDPIVPYASNPAPGGSGQTTPNAGTPSYQCDWLVYYCDPITHACTYDAPCYDTCFTWTLSGMGCKAPSDGPPAPV